MISSIFSFFKTQLSNLLNVPLMRGTIGTYLIAIFLVCALTKILANIIWGKGDK